jgi:hypothetical protein
VNLILAFGYLLPVLVVVFFVRVAFRLKHPKSRGKDVWFHLHASQEIRNNGHRIPKSLGGFIIETPFDYPPLLHYYLSILSRDRREKLEPYFGSIVDTVQAFALFLLTLVLSGKYEIAFLSGMLFAFFPILVKADARVLFLSPRPFGELLVSLSIISSLFFVSFGNPVDLLISTVLLSFVFLSSKFGAQVVFFLYPVLAVVLLSPYLLLVLLGGLGLAVLISKGHYIKVLAGHVRHTAFWKVLVTRHTMTKQYSGLGKALSESREGGLSLRQVASRLLKNQVIFALVHTPLLFVLLLTVLVQPDVILNDTFLFSMFVWVVTSFVVALLISIGPLRFLGEGSRYLEYSTIPLCALVAITLFEINNSYLLILLSLVFVYSIVLIWVNFGVSRRYFVEMPGDPADAEEMFQSMKEIPNSLVLCIPVSACFSLAYRTSHKSLYWGGNIPPKPFSSADFDFIFGDKFPFPKKDIGSIVSRFGITHVLVEKRSLDAPPEELYPNLSQYPRVFENSSFTIHKVSSAS